MLDDYETRLMRLERDIYGLFYLFRKATGYSGDIPNPQPDFTLSADQGKEPVLQKQQIQRRIRQLETLMQQESQLLQYAQAHPSPNNSPHFRTFFRKESARFRQQLHKLKQQLGFLFLRPAASGVCQGSCPVNHAADSPKSGEFTGFRATAPIGDQLRV